MRTIVAICLSLGLLTGCHMHPGHPDAGAVDLAQPRDLTNPIDAASVPDLAICIKCNQDDPHACGDLPPLCAALPPGKDGCCAHAHPVSGTP